MGKTLKELVFEKEQQIFSKVRHIGGGYYADVYKFCQKGKAPLIIKVYKTRGVMEKEVLQIKTLLQYAVSSMPEVLWIHNADESFSCDVMAMGFLEGRNGGTVNYLSAAKRQRLGEDVVNNLMAFHGAHNPKGFGEIDGDRYYSTFNEYYRERVASILTMADALYEKGELSDYVYGVAKEAAEKFDKIFYLPITQSSLVHGDYNMWNVLVDKKNCRVSAIIDPCGCMWADSEYDLYPLDSANGKKLRLFEIYKSKNTLSENYAQKKAFYRLFSEIEHYYKSNHPVVQRLIKNNADSLKVYLDKESVQNISLKGEHR